MLAFSCSYAFIFTDLTLAISWDSFSVLVDLGLHVRLLVVDKRHVNEWGQNKYHSACWSSRVNPSELPTSEEPVRKVKTETERQTEVQYVQYTVLFVLCISVIICCYAIISQVNGTGSVRIAFIATSLLLAPFGVFLRNYLGVTWNPTSKKNKEINHRETSNGSLQEPPFFYGTLVANLCGVFIVSIVKAILYNNGQTISSSSHIVSYVILSSLSTGFAGCLSTASTFVGEIRTLLSFQDNIHNEHKIAVLKADKSSQELHSKETPIMDPLCPIGAYRYALVTSASSILITLVFYGLLKHAF